MPGMVGTEEWCHFSLAAWFLAKFGVLLLLLLLLTECCALAAAVFTAAVCKGQWKQQNDFGGREGGWGNGYLSSSRPVYVL
jgi:hypothetical protein